jgi:hypothetical protein
MSTVVELFPEDPVTRVSDAELRGMCLGAKLNASLREHGPEKVMWECIASVMVECEQRRAADRWELKR